MAIWLGTKGLFEQNAVPDKLFHFNIHLKFQCANSGRPGRTYKELGKKLVSMDTPKTGKCIPHNLID